MPLETVLFDDWVDTRLAIRIDGVELDTFDHDDRLTSFKASLRGDRTQWFGAYAPTGGAVDHLDLEGWKLWFRIEPA